MFLFHTSSRRRCVFTRTRSVSNGRYESASCQAGEWCSASESTRGRREGSRSNFSSTSGSSATYSHETHAACNRTSLVVGPVLV